LTIVDFAGAGWSDEEDELALLDRDRYVVERRALGLRVRLRHVLKRNHGSEVYAV